MDKVIRMWDQLATAEKWEPDLPEGPEPIYRKIVTAISRDVERKKLRAGMRMPTHRELADILGVNVGTITRAYAYARELGLLSGEIGRGTFISNIELQQTDATPVNEPLDLMLNQPLALESSTYLRETLKQIAERGSIAHLLGYPPSNGQERHRIAGCKMAAMSGVQATPDQIILTNGVQQALLATIASCTKPGAVMATEALTYGGIRRIADFLHLGIAPIEMDEHGILPEAFETACLKQSISALVVTPSIHNPTTATLPLARRKALVEICRRHAVTLIENDIYGGLIADKTETMFSLNPDNCWYICGFSKSVNSGIRVGYAIGSPELISRARSAVHASTWAVPPLMLDIATEWIMDGTVERLIQSHRLAIAQRQAIAAACLEGIDYRSHPQSYHLWLPLPSRWRPHEFVEACLRQGVSVTSGAHFQTDPSFMENAVRLSLGGIQSLTNLETALAKVAVILASAPSESAMVI